MRESDFAKQKQGKNVNFSNFCPIKIEEQDELAKAVAVVVLRVYDLMPTGNALKQCQHSTQAEYDAAVDLIAQRTEALQARAAATAQEEAAVGNKRKRKQSVYLKAREQLGMLKKKDPSNQELHRAIEEQESLVGDDDE